jgi:hypothetical protein
MVFRSTRQAIYTVMPYAAIVLPFTVSANLRACEDVMAQPAETITIPAIPSVPVERSAQTRNWRDMERDQRRGRGSDGRPAPAPQPMPAPDPQFRGLGMDWGSDRHVLVAPGSNKDR